MKNYDIIVVGAGASGAFLAYELTKLNTDKKVLVIDGGRKVENRTCPITDGKVDHCIGCKPSCTALVEQEPYQMVNTISLLISVETFIAI